MLCCANHVQQFSQFVLFDMFDSKLVWPLWATVEFAGVENDGQSRTSENCRTTQLQTGKEIGGLENNGLQIGKLTGLRLPHVQ